VAGAGRLGAINEPIRLHIGGRQRKRRWRILDVRAEPGVDVVGSCTDLSAFADGTVAEIYASHVLEHLSHNQEIQRALIEMNRVLMPGGKLMLSVPDLDVLCRLFLDPALDIKQRFRVMRLMFGDHDHEHDVHKVGLSTELIGHFIKHAGFAGMRRVRSFGLFRDTSELVLYGKPISLNLIVWKASKG